MASSKPRKELEYRFLLVGKSGSGKSSTANNIMEEKLFPISLGLSSGTKTCEVRKSSKPQKGVTFRIVDTPGLFDPMKSNEEIREEIIKAATYLHPGLHAVLYVLQVDRYTPEERSTFNLLKNLFDENILKYVVIIFTRGDELKRNGKSLQSLLDEACEPFKEVVRECGHRVLVFNNIKRDQTDTKNLLEMVHRIQDNGEIPYSCPLQDHVNVELQRRVTVRTQEKIVREPELKRAFDKMAEDTRKAESEYHDAAKRVEDIASKKKMTETTIVKLKAKEVEDMKERERAEIEKQGRAEKERKSLEEKKKEEEEHEEKKREEERERRRKEKERKAEEERERKKEKGELEKTQKECEDLKRQLNESQKETELNEKIKKKYEEKQLKEWEKLEAKEREQTKEDVAQGKEQHWLEQVAGGLWQGARAYFGF